MHYEINVSLHGQHFFATAERSITDLTHLTAVLRAFRQAFKSDDGFVITVTKWQATGQPIDLDIIDPPTPPFVGDLTRLTELEEQVLIALNVSNDSNGGDFGFIEDIKVKGLSRQALGGVLTSLQTKDIITIYAPVYTNATATSRGDKFTQFTFNNTNR